MNTKPRLLDAYCGAGGAARGYQLAGWSVHGARASDWPLPSHPEYPPEDEALVVPRDDNQKENPHDH